MRNMKPLILANSLRGFEIHAVDGASGRIDDFYFSDKTWNIIHVVVDFGNWLTGRKVLLVPEVLGHADWRKKHIEAHITKKQVGENPDSDTILPVGLQIDKQINRSIMDTSIPETYLGMHQYVEVPAGVKEKVDPNLRSTRILKNCVIVSEDRRSIGILQDFLIDTETWEVRFLLIKTDDDRIFLAETRIVKSIDVSNRTIMVINPDEEKREWQEYDPHYMALLEIAQQ